MADESMLIQAVLNITRNAVAALDGEGRITLRTRPRRNVSIRSHVYPLVVQIDIIDNGEGIPEDLAETLFFPMVTGRAEGTGLGLSIAQSLIHQHNGLIEFSSKPGETCFTILIPLENGHD
jgi:two-component system nitrogen regulation sensor histidine kinase GlnL